jgi:hypothetical protein
MLNGIIRPLKRKHLPWCMRYTIPSLFTHRPNYFLCGPHDITVFDLTTLGPRVHMFIIWQSSYVGTKSYQKMQPTNCPCISVTQPHLTEVYDHQKGSTHHGVCLTQISSLFILKQIYILCGPHGIIVLSLKPQVSKKIARRIFFFLEYECLLLSIYQLKKFHHYSQEPKKKPSFEIRLNILKHNYFN